MYDVFEPCPGLPHILITEADEEAALAAIKDAIEAVLEGRSGTPLVTIHAPHAPGTLSPRVAALKDERTSHLVVDGSWPGVGNPLPTGPHRDPAVHAARRAAARVASALMHCEDFDMNSRLQPAFEVFVEAARTESLDAIGGLEWAVSRVGWKLGDHPIVAAARVFGGLPESVYDTEEQELDASPEAVLARCLTLARELGVDAEEEQRLQSYDAAHADCAWPAVEVTLADTAAMHTACQRLGRRAVRMLQDCAESSEIPATDLLWELPEGEPMQWVCNLGAMLREAAAPVDAAAHADWHQALTRVALAFDLLGLCCMGVQLESAPEHVVAIAHQALGYALGEVAACAGLTHDFGQGTAPLALPFWPAEAGGGPSRAREELAALQGSLLSVGETADLRTLAMLDLLRAKAQELVASPEAREDAEMVVALIEVKVLKLAVAASADVDHWLQLSRELRLSEIALQT